MVSCQLHIVIFRVIFEETNVRKTLGSFQFLKRDLRNYKFFTMMKTVEKNEVKSKLGSKLG